MSMVLDFSSYKDRRRLYSRKPVIAEEIDTQIDKRPVARSSSTTAANGRVRKERQEVWRMAEAATRYWRLRLDFQSAVSWAQRMEIPEGDFHPSDPQERDRTSVVESWRAALVKQLLTPAWDVASVKWKEAALARGDHHYTGVKPERIERAIADDLAFLAAHPTRRSQQRRDGAPARVQRGDAPAHHGCRRIP